MTRYRPGPLPIPRPTEPSGVEKNAPIEQRFPQRRRSPFAGLLGAAGLASALASAQLGCTPPGNEAASSAWFVVHQEFHTISQVMSKRGVPDPEPRDKPGEAIAILDANMDGLHDFVVSNGTDYYFVFLNTKDQRGRHEFQGRRWLIGSEDDGVRNISKALGLHDFNNDGALDLHLCPIGKGTLRTAHRPSDEGLFRDGGNGTVLSRKDGTFVYQDFGADGVGNKRGAVFEDFDGDGRFDCYLTTSPYYGPWYPSSSAPSQLFAGIGDQGAFGPDLREQMLVNAPPHFWADEEGRGTINFKSAVIRDFDGDGQPDLATGAIADIMAYPYPKKTSPDEEGYQGEWFRGVFIFRNISQPGQIRFEDVSHSAIENAYGKTDQMHIYSVIPADFNGDGRLDLFVSGPRGDTMAKAIEHSTAKLRIYRNDSTPGQIKFTDVTEAAGLSYLNSPKRAPHPAIPAGTDDPPHYRHAGFATAAAFDFDNDADVDLFATSPYLGDASPAPGGGPVRGTGWVFLNDGAGRFTTIHPRDHGLHVLAKDLSYGDLNNDGRVDLVTVKPNYGPTPPGGDYVFFNAVDNGNHYLKVKVTTDGNAHGIGTKVSVYQAGTDRLLGYDEVRTDFRYRSKKSTTLHFGLGEVSEVDVKLVFRDGHEVMHPGLRADTEHRLSPLQAGEGDAD